MVFLEFHPKEEHEAVNLAGVDGGQSPGQFGKGTIRVGLSPLADPDRSRTGKASQKPAQFCRGLPGRHPFVVRTIYAQNDTVFQERNYGVEFASLKSGNHLSDHRVCGPLCRGARRQKREQPQRSHCTGPAARPKVHAAPA